MNVILNCAVDDSAVPALARHGPLALAPFLGATVLEHALAALAASGVKGVQLVVADGVEAILRVVGRGEAWGLHLEVRTEAAPAEGSREVRTVALDRLPQLPACPLWGSYRAWSRAQLSLLPLLASQRVGMRALAPGVFVGLRSRIASDTRLIGPCWIGAQVFLGSGAVVGPGTVVEDGCYLDRGAEVAGSIVGPQTYVGRFTEVRDSFAWGSALLHLDTGSQADVADPFLLGSLRPRISLPSSPAPTTLAGQARFQPYENATPDQDARAERDHRAECHQQRLAARRGPGRAQRARVHD